MKKRPLITLGLICSDNGLRAKIDLLIYSIMHQDYPEFELLICTDVEDDDFVQNILDGLHISRTEESRIENCVRTELHAFRLQEGTAEAMNWVVENAQGEILLFNSLGEFLYDSDSFLRLADALSESANAMVLACTLFPAHSESGVKILPDGSVLTKLSQSKSAKQREALLKRTRTGCRGVCFRTEALRSYRFEVKGYYENLCRAIAVLGTEMNVLPYQCVFNATTAEKVKDESCKWPVKKETREHQEVLNRSDYLVLVSAIEAIKSRRQKKECLEKLCQIRKTILLNAGRSCWGMTDSQHTFMVLTDKLLRYAEWPHFSSLKQLREQTDRAGREKFKIVFFVQEVWVWLSQRSVYEAACRNPETEAQLVYVPFYHVSNTWDDEKHIAAYQDAGYEVIRCEDYDITKECPDLAIYTKPYDAIPPAFYIYETHRVIPRIMLLPYCIEFVDHPFLRETYKSGFYYYAWKCVAYTRDIYRRASQVAYKHGENLMCSAQPRVDLRFMDYSSEDSYISIKKKARGRRIILWNTHFFGEGEEEASTYFRFGKSILDYFETHRDLVLVWRPHPLFFGALAKAEKCSAEEIYAWFDSLNQKDNIVIDRSPGYLPMFAVSDAMISDISSFVPGFLSWGKPLIVTGEVHETEENWQGLAEGLRFASGIEDIISFLDEIRSADILAEPSISQKVMEEMFIPEHGLAGEQMIHYIVNQIVKESDYKFQDDF